ncbi:Asp-tRNA(Asn)/Glu-tRNA(Gln) amidotransferase subunit GatC [Paraliomyxa miuraensis]|uniref:Asp-tRNA(Asn)/Glu-tRNA(Gln) amidotransferase subunit GatC n=1 Tax=Paraliomyxa miuraensis TaxID=376150 RepID=UPI00224E4A82|nr:Asp-tRNA(Asn)/Glu-tRNA(Gln) amidotransferase subunit GatC [Paraliomyxa miuraensis]MCX4246197.1 aspartyl/glutamyl-tRNA amidotransferase subunit C [Paraliomyxa miuraensis]
MSTISRQECHELASLARLSLNEEEAERFAAELSPILAYLEQLQAVDTMGVEEHLPPSRPPLGPSGPVGSTGAVGPAGSSSGLRDDVTAPPLPRERALAGVPEVLDGHVKVPKFKKD